MSVETEVNPPSEKLEAPSVQIQEVQEANEFPVEAADDKPDIKDLKETSHDEESKQEDTNVPSEEVVDKGAEDINPTTIEVEDVKQSQEVNESGGEA